MRVVAAYCRAMARLPRLETHRFVGDKRTQRVHDTDRATAACELDDLVRAETYIAFGPDTLPEARNRCYRPCPHCVEREVA